MSDNPSVLELLVEDLPPSVLVRYKTLYAEGEMEYYRPDIPPEGKVLVPVEDLKDLLAGYLESTYYEDLPSEAKEMKDRVYAMIAAVGENT